MNFARHRRSGFTLVEIMIVVFIVGMLAAMALPAFIKSRTISHSKACINNLRIMDAAKEQAALEMRWGSGQTITPGTVDETNVLYYVKRGDMPECPGGGSYTWNAISTDPTCSRGALDVHTL